VQLRIGMHTVRKAVNKNEEAWCVWSQSCTIYAYVLTWVELCLDVCFTFRHKTWDDLSVAAVSKFKSYVRC